MRKQDDADKRVTRAMVKGFATFEDMIADWRTRGSGNGKDPVREVYGWAADELEDFLRTKAR